MKDYIIQSFIRLTFIAFLLLNISVFKSQAQQNLPATHLQFNDDTSKLQFAIVSDLWGGYQVGVFDDAVEKIELLQPQFVMSIGDLIDGKTYDTTVFNNQWNEFDSWVNSLSMPFFYVPGNHDISNSWMEKEWEKRLGMTYYHFIQKNVLFLCINTQDGGSSGIHAEQIAYLKKAIEDNPDVRWTFVFMHRPVWKGEGDNQGGYEEIEAELAGRNYTLFSGHNHTYLKRIKNENNHYVLGSTGGGTNLLGEKFGKFDHITWVTLKDNEPPKIINLKLDGMIKDDVVNENTYPITNTLIKQNWITTPGFVAQNMVEDSVTPVIIFNNPSNYPLKISGNFSNIEGFTIEPQSVDLIIPPNSEKKQSLTIKSDNESKIDLSLLPFIEIELMGSYNYKEEVYELPARKRLLLNWKYILPELSSAKKIASVQFESPDTASLISVRVPEYLDNKYYWSGTEDCLLRFKLIGDKKYLYLVATIYDDQLILGENIKRDLIYVDFEDKNGIGSKFTIYPDTIELTIQTANKTVLSTTDIQLKSSVEGDSLIKIMLRVPINKIAKDDNSFRFNIGYRDQDNNPVSSNSTLYWKPLWGSKTDYKLSGTFILGNKK